MATEVAIFSTTRTLRLRVEDAQLERLADRLGAIHHVQLAQDLLHVVLHRQRADLEDRADLEVRFAEVDPLQDVELAHRQDAAAWRGPTEAGRQAKTNMPRARPSASCTPCTSSCVAPRRSSSRVKAPLPRGVDGEQSK